MLRTDAASEACVVSKVLVCCPLGCAALHAQQIDGGLEDLRCWVLFDAGLVVCF